MVQLDDLGGRQMPVMPRSAKRIISTAPMAKFGREEHRHAGRARSVVDLGGVPAARADDARHAGLDRGEDVRDDRIRRA